MTNTDEYAKARRRAAAKYRFFVHAAVYVAVMLLLVIIDLVTSPGDIWFVWPLIGWGSHWDFTDCEPSIWLTETTSSMR